MNTEREIEILRQIANKYPLASGGNRSDRILFQAAVGAIQRDVEKMREALRPFAAIAASYHDDPRGFLVGPSPLMAVMDECERAHEILYG
jgi:hypothetical protein